MTDQPTCSDCGQAAKHAALNLCHRCYQRRWRAGTLPPKQPKPGGVRRDCRCKEADHTHGTRTAYVIDKCRCADCREATRIYEADRRAKANAHRWNPERPATDLVDAQPAREHLQALMAAGMGLKTIISRGRIASGSVTAIIYGKWRDNPGHPDHRPPRRRITADLERRILAVTLDLADGRSIDGTGTRRRLQALVAIGWSQTRLARQLGIAMPNFTGLIHGRDPRVQVATARKVADLYDRLWSTPPTAAHRWERGGIARAKNVARQHGWAPPMAWDDDTIDDPEATPDLGEGARGIAVDDIEWLADSGDGVDQIARRLGVQVDTVWSALHRHGRDDLVDRLKARRAAA